MQKHREFASHGHYSPFLGILSAAFRHSCSPTFQVSVRAEAAQQILRTLDQQRPEATIAGLADAQLLIDVARLASAWR